MANTFTKYPSDHDLTLTGSVSIDSVGYSIVYMRTSVSSSTTITLNFTTADTYVGNPSSSATYTVPSVSTRTNQWFYIKNRGTANITLSGGASEIYYNAAAASFVVYPGEAYKLINDGTYWLVF